MLLARQLVLNTYAVDFRVRLNLRDERLFPLL